MNIDVKKLKADILEMNEMRKSLAAGKGRYWDEYPKKPTDTKDLYLYWQACRAFEYRWSADRATALYSLMAHSRGHLHIRKRWVPQVNAPRVLVNWELLDQNNYLNSDGLTWVKDYLLSLEAPRDQSIEAPAP